MLAAATRPCAHRPTKTMRELCDAYPGKAAKVRAQQRCQLSVRERRTRAPSLAGAQGQRPGDWPHPAQSLLEATLTATGQACMKVGVNRGRGAPVQTSG
jgi:hypothetical protein